MLLLLFIPEYLHFITLNMLFKLFFLEYISFLNVLMLNLLYHPCLKLYLSGIWSEAFISLFMHVVIGFESYALFAIMNWRSYFFKLLITALQILCRVLVLLLLVSRDYSWIYIYGNIAFGEVFNIMAEYFWVIIVCIVAGESTSIKSN